MRPGIRAIIIDDEPLSRNLIHQYASCRPDVRIIAESGTGSEAIRMIKEHKPDLIFLDVQLSDINGFQLLDRIGVVAMPAIIFITAYDEYALRAFEVNAADFLLKPFDKERFFVALDRALHQIRSTEKLKIMDRIYSVVSNYWAGASRSSVSVAPKRVPVRDEKGRTRYVDIRNIDWIEAAGDYVCIHVGEENYVIRRPLNDVQSSLPSDLFVRIHRSHLVNKDRITHLEERENRNYVVELSTSKILPVSRSYYKTLKSSLKKA